MDDTHFRAGALPYYSHSNFIFSYSVVNARQFRAAYLSRLFALSASFSQYCENCFCKKWILLCKVGFSCVKNLSKFLVSIQQKDLTKFLVMTPFKALS